MKREVKFRAYNETTKKMMAWEELKEDMFETLCLFDNICADVPPVMQYSGLKDNESKEMYEGDVIEDTFNGLCDMERLKPRGVIAFEDGCFCCVYQGNRGSYRLSDRLDYKIKVIGNIYENPELKTPKEAQDGEG